MYDTYKEAKNSLISKKRFFLFLALFEILFYISWHQPNDIAGTFIAVIILPIGAQIFSAFTAAVILPITLSKRASRVNVFDVDKRGGLKPISELLIVLTSIYFFQKMRQRDRDLSALTYDILPELLILMLWQI